MKAQTIFSLVSKRCARDAQEMLKYTIAFCLVFTLGVGSAWGTSQRVSAYGNISSGQTYWIGATVSSTDYYFKAGGGIATNTGLSGTSTTTPMTDGTVLKFTGSSTSWTMQFTNSNYITLSSSKANGKYESQKSSASWTFSNNNSLIRMTINSHVLQRNSNANTYNFGSYGHGGSGYQKDVWLEPAYSVIYDKNGATGGTVPDTVYYLYNTTVTVSSNSGTLVKTGYTFSGWNTQADGNGTNYTAGSGTFSITSNKKLYAKWTATASCSATPSIGVASLNGPFFLSHFYVYLFSLCQGSFQSIFFSADCWHYAITKTVIRRYSGLPSYIYASCHVSVFNLIS